ncbi:MAG TPA: hypothetical protein VFN48_01960 [Solirubrobacteraceae bacterium]|nr:hypothetical protein [Solirubrobacteraceae bacterium]
MTRILPARVLAGVAVVATALAGGVAAAVAGAHTAAPAVTRRPTLHVSVASVAGRQERIIETTVGRAVYLLSGDSARHPKCRGACLGIWPAVSAADPTARGIHGHLGVWRHNGIRQVTLDGHPLYTFSYDTSGAKASGEGIKSFGGEWFALSPAAQPLRPVVGHGTQAATGTGSSAPVMATTGATTTPGYGY